MSWRTIVAASRCRLDYKMGFMVVRAEKTKKIFLDEIAVLLIENPALSLTGLLLEGPSCAILKCTYPFTLLQQFVVLLLKC